MPRCVDAPLAETVIIDGELPDLNTYIDLERANRHAATSLKADWTRGLAWQFRAMALTPREEPVRVRCVWYTPNRRKDPDNVAWAKKLILDALVVAGVLLNDGRRNVAGFQDDFGVDAEHPRVEVTLAEEG